MKVTKTKMFKKISQKTDSEHFSDFFEFGQVVREKTQFKDMFYLELRQPLCLVERNHLCNFDRRHHEEHFCDFFLNLNKWVRRRGGLKTFYLELW